VLDALRAKIQAYLGSIKVMSVVKQFVTERMREKAKSPWYKSSKSIRYKLAFRLATITRGRIKSPHYREQVEYYYKRDIEHIDKSRAADGEHVVTWGLWAAEAYTPANISSLMRGLETLGGESTRENPADWLRRQRNNPGGSNNLFFANPGSRFLPSGFEIEMPKFAEAAGATISTVTSSLTVFTLHFILKNEEQRRIDDILHSDYLTRLSRFGAHGMQIHAPDSERHRFIGEVRLEWARAATAWFEKHFPGLLAQSPNGVPTCELAVLENLSPFPPDTAKFENYQTLMALGMQHSSLIFDSVHTEVKPLFAPSNGQFRPVMRHSIVAITKASFEKQDVESWGGGETRYLQKFDNTFREVFTNWILTYVLQHYETNMAATRDVLATVIGGRNSIRAVARLRRDTADGADAATVARDIKNTIIKYLLFSERNIFVRRLSSHETKVSPFTESLGQSLVAQATYIVSNVAELNDILNAQAGLLSAYANLRLQPWIIFLAVVSAIAGGIGAIPPARDLISWGISAIYPTDKPVYEINVRPALERANGLQ
jgi:hypothetical protein